MHLTHGLIQRSLKKRQIQEDGRYSADWMLAEEIPNMPPDFGHIWLNCFVREFAEPSGRAYERILAFYEGYHMWYYFDRADADLVGENLARRFERGPTFMTRVNQEIIRLSDELRAYAAQVPETNLRRFSNRKLYQIYRGYEDLHTAYYQWGWIPVAVDMFTENLTNHGKAILRTYGVREHDLNAQLALLTTPTRPSLLKEEHERFMHIGIAVQRDRKQTALMRELMRKFKQEEAKQYGLYTHSPEYEAKFEERVRDLEGKIKKSVRRALQEHYATYFYTKWIFSEEQGVYSFKHYLKQLVRLVTNDPHVAKSLKREQKESRQTLAARNALIQRLKLSRAHRQFFTEWGSFMVTKIYRRFAQLFALYKTTPLVEEIGRRIGLTLQEARFLTPGEMERALKGAPTAVSTLRQRVRFTLYYADKKTDCYLTGKEARIIAGRVRKTQTEDVQEIHGQTGCAGTARGVVRIVNVTADMKKMQKGDVLVAISTQPDLLPAMRKAAAFVTDQGGVTSHAAIVAREMRTPCVIGTKIATGVLRDGDFVEVNANHGVIKVLKRV